MEQKQTVLAVFIAIFSFTQTIFAASIRETVDGITYTVDDTKESLGAMVVDISPSITNVIIPPTVVLNHATYTVTTIGNRIFHYNYNPNYNTVSSLTLPSTIVNIAPGAFSVSTSMQEIKINGTSANFAVVDGVLYNKTITKVIYAPAKKNLVGYTLPTTVTIIGGGAFSNNQSLTSFTIPKTITYIEDGLPEAARGSYGAFYACSNLTSVIFEAPCKLSTIPSCCFLECSKLSDITIPASVKHIKSYAFRDCNSFNKPLSVTQVEHISYNAFESCDLLEEVIAPTTLKSLDNYAFNACSNVKKIIIPNECEVTVIPEGCFRFNSKVTDVQLSPKITSIKSVAFSHCSSLGNITLPTELKTIDTEAFSFCGKLNTISFNKKLTTIGDGAFCDNIVLVNYTLPNSLKTIGVGAFYHNAALEKATIPASVTSIGGAAYAMNAKLKTFVVEPSNNYYKTIDNVLFTKDTKTLMAYPAASTRAISYTIPAGVVTIQEGAFSCANFTHVTLPSSLTTIYNGAFAECKKLTELTIPSLVTSIGKSNTSAWHYSCFSKNIIKGSNVKSLYMLNATLPPIIDKHGSGDKWQNNVLPNIDDIYSTTTNYPIVYVKKSAYDNDVYQKANIWSLMPTFAYEIPTTLPVSGIASIGRDFDVDLSNSPAVAYLAESATQTGNKVYVNMREIIINGKSNGKYIPSRTGTKSVNGIDYEVYTGALIKGNASEAITYRIGENADNTIANGGTNYLISVTDATQIGLSQTINAETYTNLILKNGRFKYVNTGGTISYNKSYLSMPAHIVGSYNATFPAKQFVFSFKGIDDTTGLNRLNVDNPNCKENIYYNLQGVRISSPMQKGIYIHNGKKTLMPNKK